jgi:ParB family chromosome partitioning protein
MSRKALGRGLEALISEQGDGGDRVSTLPVGGGEIKIRLDQVEANPYQPRGRFDPERMKEIVQSVRELGLVQPILVRPHGEKYQIVAGERRFRAAQEVGLRTIPAVIRDIGEREMLEMALIENLQREDLNPVDEAEAYRVLREKFGMTQTGIADRVGKDRSTVANTMRLLQLPEEVRRSVSRGTLSMGHARALLGLDSAVQMVNLAHEIETRSLSVRDVETRVRQLVAGGGKPRVRASRKPEIVDLEERLQRWLGTKVRIDEAQGKGRLAIEFYGMDDLDRILEIFRSGTRLG